jgi:cell division protein FtsL
MTATQYDRTAAATAAARPAPAPAPAPSRSPRPPLRVVEGEAAPRPVDRRRRARLRVAVTMVVVVGGLFGLVASHVVLTQGQFRLQQVESRASEAQARYERLRLQVAALESPERIVAAAQERLGMVPPPGVKYLSPTGVSEQPAGNGAGATPGKGQVAEGPEDWSAVKRHLASQP